MMAKRKQEDEGYYDEEGRFVMPPPPSLVEGYDDTPEEALVMRLCGIPTCQGIAVPGSLFCGWHQPQALGEAASKEAAWIMKELGKIASIVDEKEKRRAAGRFRARLEKGEFSSLFAGRTRELMAEAGKSLELYEEVGALRLAMSRALQEIDDPERMALVVSRLANAVSRAAKAHHLVNRPEGLDDWLDGEPGNWELGEAET
jgi:hypothetical protein